MKKDSFFPAYSLCLILGFIGGAVADRLTVLASDKQNEPQTKVEATVEDKEAIFQQKVDSVDWVYDRKTVGLRNRFQAACDSIEESRGTKAAKNAAIAKEAKKYNAAYDSVNMVRLNKIIELNQKYR